MYFSKQCYLRTLCTTTKLLLSENGREVVPIVVKPIEVACSIRNSNPKSKIDFGILALSIGCRNKHISQRFNQILILLISLLSLWSPVQVVPHGLGLGHINQSIIIKIKCCDQCLFLQPILSARILKSFFDFHIWIPNVV